MGQKFSQQLHPKPKTDMESVPNPSSNATRVQRYNGYERKKVISTALFGMDGGDNFSFRPGENLTVTSILQDGWYEGIRSDGKKGRFPKVLVEEIQDETEQNENHPEIDEEKEATIQHILTKLFKAANKDGFKIQAENEGFTISRKSKTCALTDITLEHFRKAYEAFLEPSMPLQIQCNFFEHNGKATKIQKKIFEQLQGRKNIHLEKVTDKKNCPIILTALMASRAGADIDKALKEAEIDEYDRKWVLLIRILPSKDEELSTPMDKRKDFKLDLTFLADNITLELLKCDHNEAQFQALCDELYKPCF